MCFVAARLPRWSEQQVINQDRVRPVKIWRMANDQDELDRRLSRMELARIFDGALARSARARRRPFRRGLALLVALMLLAIWLRR
jgi:hypothetical protein